MDNLISVTFGIPKHGWLPVKFQDQDFQLDFDASDVLNDPIEELYDAITKIQDNECRQITWWLEPGAYFFDIEKQGRNITLIIRETVDLHNDKAEKEVIHTISGDDSRIIKPLQDALKTFCSFPYDEDQWPYKLDKNKIETL
jgi:hypothetical protein